MANAATAAPSVQIQASSRRWAIAGLLSLAAVIAYIDRTNLSFALNAMPKSFGLTPASKGMALSAFFWTYAALQIPAGWLVDRFGVRRTLFVGFLVWSLVAGATGLAGSVASLVFLRLVLGAGEAIVLPASLRYIGDHFEEQRRGLAIGIYMSGTKYGPALGSLAAAYLIRDHGWRVMFLITGFGSLLWLIPWALLVRDDQQRERKSETTAGPGWGMILASPVMWGTFLATFCYMYFVYFCMTWMPSYFERQGLSLTGSGWYTFMSFSGMATVAIVAGYLADRLIARGHNPVTVRRSFTITGFLLAFSEIGGAFTHSGPVILCLAVFSLCGLGLATANYWALTQTLMPPGSVGRVAGIQNTAANLAGVVAPWLSGWMVQRTGRFDAPLLAIGFWLAIGVACYVFAIREKYALRV
jgi:MFS family permease